MEMAVFGKEFKLIPGGPGFRQKFFFLLNPHFHKLVLIILRPVFPSLAL
jgi:hypothetical protein